MKLTGKHECWDVEVCLWPEAVSPKWSPRTHHRKEENALRQLEKLHKAGEACRMIHITKRYYSLDKPDHS